jgi:large conductance mechanosensitive channel
VNPALENTIPENSIHVIPKETPLILNFDRRIPAEITSDNTKTVCAIPSLKRSFINQSILIFFSKVRLNIYIWLNTKTQFMKMIKEFKEFAMRGNVMDMAVGIIIGGAFGKIVSSFVSDVIMPPIGVLVGGVNFTDLKITIKDQILDTAGEIITPAVTLNYGNFVQVTFDFIIIAFAIFMMIKFMNNLSRKKEVEPAAPAAPPPTPEDIVLLKEIRDLLKKQ